MCKYRYDSVKEEVWDTQILNEFTLFYDTIKKRPLNPKKLKVEYEVSGTESNSENAKLAREVKTKRIDFSDFVMHGIP